MNPITLACPHCNGLVRLAQRPRAAADYADAQPVPGPATPRSEVALAGPDGRDAARLLGRSKAEGVRLLADITASAVQRLLSRGGAENAGQLFDDRERNRLVAMMAATNATGELLGRARIRLRQRQVLARHGGEHADHGDSRGDPISVPVEFCGGPGSGVPGPCPSGGAGQEPRSLHDHVGAWAGQLRRLPAATVQRARSVVSNKYQRLVQRYGRRYALAIMGAGILGLPLPIPGSSLLTAAPVMAVAELHRHLAGTAQHADDRLFTQDELNRLGAEFIRELLEAWQAEYPPQPTAERFSDEPTAWESFADLDPEPLPPTEAIDYFRRLIPELGIDPRRDGPRLERQAFTLAEATEDLLLKKVQAAIADALGSGQALVPTTQRVQSLLDAAGVSPRNPQYSEMVARTNLMDSYNAGAMRELQDPDVADTFPVWKYLAIVDGRQRPRHGEKNGKYYPNSASFAEVRGTDPGDVCNCRCSFMPIDKFEAKGLKVSSFTEGGWDESKHERDAGGQFAPIHGIKAQADARHPSHDTADLEAALEPHLDELAKEHAIAAAKSLGVVRKVASRKDAVEAIRRKVFERRRAWESIQYTDGVEEFSWRSYKGKRGGQGWVNDAGEVRYQPDKPGDSEGGSQPDAGTRSKSAPNAQPRPAKAGRPAHVAEEQPSEKAQRAKAAHVLVGRDIQRYAEEHNEPRFARAIGGVSFPDSEPVDVVVGKGGVAAHGIELKTMVAGKDDKLTMNSYAQVRKIEWEKANNATFHTIVSDDRQVYNAGGPPHNEGNRVYYYRRGVAGSARIGTMYRVEGGEAELKRLMAMPEDQLPKEAQRTDGHLRAGRWKFFQDAEGKGYKNSKTGQVFRAKK